MMVKDRRGGNAGKWPYKRGDPKDRIFINPYKDPYRHMRDPYWLPQRDRCRWSLEIVRRHEVQATRTARFAKFNETLKNNGLNERLQVVMGVLTVILVISLAVTLYFTLF